MSASDSGLTSAATTPTRSDSARVELDVGRHGTRHLERRAEVAVPDHDVAHAVGDKIDFEFAVDWNEKPPIAVTKVKKLPADTALEL